ncbi:hypothetical protein TEA_024697 [Camellia sinensis var. sinensis]|uniref:FAD/NAD(P)-binding domain-containing protein n=1 Tax=Camellia sinensis var. sinensis TaxID=542762 RepID=A0A4S4D9G7_CAMSN|nr:hypothetical protein TEA_024697 [Camellia sinensis var. sinensis]
MSVEEKFRIVRSVGEECIQEDELLNLLTKKPEPVCYDGFEPSGRMHIAQRQSKKLSTSLSDNGTALMSFDYDLIIIGAGVGGHRAALHAVKKGLKIAIIEEDVIRGTCVNRGCVPSKALFAQLAMTDKEKHPNNRSIAAVDKVDGDKG